MLDIYSIFFLGLTLVSSIVTLCALPQQFRVSTNNKRFLFFYLLTIAATVEFFLSGTNLMKQFFFFEIMTLASFAYVPNDESEYAKKASFSYLAYGIAGGLVMLYGLMLLYYTFIHSLNRYERKKDKIFYIAASLAVVVRLAAIVLDKEKTAVCMDIYLPCTILQTVLLLGMNVQTSNAFCRLSLGMSYIFYVFAARQAAAVFSYQFVKYSLHDELNTPSRMKIMTLSLTCVVTCILEIILVCAVYALMKKKKIQYASTTIFGAEVMVYCAAYIFRQQQRRMDMSAVTAGFIWIIIIIISLLFFGFQCQYSRLQELYAEKQQIQQELENTEYFYEKIQQGQDTIRNIRHDMKNRLSGILAAMQNEGENRQQIEAELQTALGLISSVKEERYCNNNYINSILSYKLQNIASDQIDVSVRMLYPEKLNIDYGDMGVLLGNLIDNAVEACEYVKTEKPYIHIKG